MLREIGRRLLGFLGIVTVVLLLDVGCVFRHLTGFPCPGCGTTRAYLAFFDGDIVEAFYYHPLFWLTGLLLLYVLIRGFRATRRSRYVSITILSVYLTVYVVRMILLFPDTPPMAYNYDALGYRLFEQYIQR